MKKCSGISLKNKSLPVRIENQQAPHRQIYFALLQRIGCIDAPEREGREVRYGFRHYLQALLVRKLLWERMPAERIARLLKSRSTSEYKKMLLDGIEIVVRASGQSGREKKTEDQAVETWVRVLLAPGIEIHLCHGQAEIKSSELKSLISHFEKAVRTHLLAKGKSQKSRK